MPSARLSAAALHVDFGTISQERRLDLIDLQFRRPPTDLAHAVIGFAQRRDRTAWEHGRELPIANPMLQFMLGGDYVVGGETMPRAALWGPMVRPAISRTCDPAEVFMVVLTASGAARLAQSDLASLMDRATALDALGGDRVWRDIPERIAEADNFDARIDIAVEHLRHLLTTSGPPRSRALAIANAILGHQLRGPVASAAAKAGLSVRGLHGVFAREIGCGPKRLMRIARLQRVLRALHPRPWSPEMPEDAFLEYVDQSHLDRDFLDLTQLSRSSYLAAKVQRGDRLVHTVV